MIFMPPRHGKSELASRRFPAWYLGRNPRKQIIAASYNSDLASDFGRDVRNIVAAPQFGAVFGKVTLAADSQAANRWHTNSGGAYVAAGVGTAVTGRGADVLLIDDPLKDREEADSETTRERVWNWYTSTAYTRLMPGGAVVLIQTRWHEDDLAGRLLEAQKAGGDKWEVLELPAISGDGEALWPQWYPIPALERIRAAIGARDWSALYQQRPQPDEGTYFQRDWFRRYRDLPPALHHYGASDFGVTEHGDFTEHGVFGLAPNDDIYIVDWWHGQTTADVWIDAQLDLIQARKPLAWFGEAGVIRRATEPFMLKRSRERKVFCRFEWVASIQDKAARARAFQARASQGKVWLPEGPVGDRILDQLLRFPTGKHDDVVDACGLIGRVIDETHPAIARPEAGDKPKDRWAEAFKRGRSQTDEWKTA
jgi:predicted phage terminase large subunit-like protein